MNNSEPLPPVPAALGYRMPAEWHPHESTWLSWPKNPITWPDRVREVQEIYLQMISLLAARERIDLLVDEAQTETAIRHSLLNTGTAPERIRFHLVSTADCWIRDYGPNFLLRQNKRKVELAFNHWTFNAWGNKYEELEKDRMIPEKLEPVLRVPRFVPPMVLEGGAIDVNGEGVCLTTQQCLLNSNRNGACSGAEIEQCLKDFLGVHQFIWLGKGIAGDDTDGHVDNLARFVAPRTILCALEKDPTDENYEALQDNHQRLKAAHDLHGRPFEIVTLPMPGPLKTSEGRLPASYANFYIANGLVLVPVFDDPDDAVALQTLQRLFPDRRIIGIDCRAMLLGLGAIHCVTQQQPVRIQTRHSSGHERK